MTESFSGCHPYRPQCVIESVGTDVPWAVDEAEHVTRAIGRGECPRCHGPLPEPPVLPAGSRVTQCRCIPICGACGSDEAYDLIDIEDWQSYENSDFVFARKLREERQVSEPAVMSTDSAGRPILITSRGVGEVQLRPHPGGWAEFGYDDSADEAEQQR